MRINRALIGADAGFADSYGMSPHDFAELLNAWRAVRTSIGDR